MSNFIASANMGTCHLFLKQTMKSKPYVLLKKSIYLNKVINYNILFLNSNFVHFKLSFYFYFSLLNNESFTILHMHQNPNLQQYEVQFSC